MRSTLPRQRLALVALAATTALLAAACGGGGTDPTVTDGSGATSPSAEEDGSTGEGTGTDDTDSSTGDGEDTGTQSAGAECPSDVPLPEDTATHGAVAVDSSTVEIEAGDQFFEPTCLTEVPQGTLTLTVNNTGQAVHNVQVEAQNIDRDIDPGSSVTIEVEVGAEPIVLTCKYHKTLGMHGVIVPQA